MYVYIHTHIDIYATYMYTDTHTYIYINNMIWPSLHGCLEISSPTFTKEAKTQTVHLRPYHDPTKLKSREDVEMRILYKGVGLVGMQGRACR